MEPRQNPSLQDIDSEGRNAMPGTEKNVAECPFPAKRKADLTFSSPHQEDRSGNSLKRQFPLDRDYSLEVDRAESIAADEEEDEDYAEGEEEEEEDDDDDEDEEEEEYAEQSDDGQPNREAQCDRKGKGVLRNEKGKGKLVEECESDSSDSALESDIESDLSDDPLAEVDLDNILPSRTRRRNLPTGLSITNHVSKDDKGDANA